MKITFTRGEEHTYTATALRDDGVLLQVPGNDRKAALPHDIAHFFVEQGLGLRRGFWGRVADGAIYGSMKVISGRKTPQAAERSRSIIREREQQGTGAEVLVDAFMKVMHEGLENDEAAARVILNREWSPDKPERGSPDAEEIKRICLALREAEQQWQALEVGQSITVLWPAAKHRKR